MGGYQKSTGKNKKYLFHKANQDGEVKIRLASLTGKILEEVTHTVLDGYGNKGLELPMEKWPKAGRYQLEMELTKKEVKTTGKIQIDL